MDVHRTAAMLATFLRQRACQAEDEIGAGRIFAAVTSSVAGIHPDAVAFRAQQVRFRDRFDGKFLFFVFELFHITSLRCVHDSMCNKMRCKFFVHILRKYLRGGVALDNHLAVAQ